MRSAAATSAARDGAPNALTNFCHAPALSSAPSHQMPALALALARLASDRVEVCHCLTLPAVGDIWIHSVIVDDRGISQAF